MQTLHATLFAAPDLLLENWVTLKPCQVQPLIDNLVKRVESDEYATSTLTRLVGLRSTLATIVESHPQAFDSLCKYALSQLRNHPDQICQFQPFLQDASLSELSSFDSYLELVSLIASRQEESLEVCFRRMHPFLASASAALLRCLPEQFLHSSAEIWRSQIRSDDPVNALAALHVACNIQGCAQDTQESPFSSFTWNHTLRQWASKCSSLFEGDRARSIVETTILTTLKLCSSKGPHFEDLHGVLQIAPKILHAVPMTILDEWLRSHVSAVHKLVQKLSRPELSPDLRFTALEFQAAVDRSFKNSKWLDLVTTAVQYITGCRPQSHLSDHRLRSNSIEVLIAALNSRTTRSMSHEAYHTTLFDLVHTLVQFIIERCRPGQNPSAEHGMQMHQAELLLHHLEATTCDPPNQLMRAIVQILNQMPLPDWWSLDLRDISSSPETCMTGPLCIHDQERRRLGLCTKISFMVLRVASAGGPELSLLTFSLLRRQLCTNSQSWCHRSCNYPQTMNPRSAVENFQMARTVSGDWRKDLSSLLAESSDRVTANFEFMVCELTKDLQSRCDNIEFPLLEARAEVVDVRLGLERTEELLQNARASCVQTEQVLHSEKQVLHNTIALLEETRNSLFSLQQQYEQSQIDLASARDMLERNQEEHRQEVDSIQQQSWAEKEEMQRVHDLRASDLEDQLRELQSSATTLRDENEWLGEEMKRELEELALKHQVEADRLTQESKTIQEAANHSAERLESKLSAVTAENQRLESELGRRETEVGELTSAKESLNTELEGAQRDLRASGTEVEQLRTALSQKNTRAGSLEQECSASRSQLKKQEQKIKELEASANSWQEQCKAKEKALEKAKKAERGVLAILQNHSSSTFSPVASRGSTVTATAPPTPRLPEASFESEDDEDYNEILGEGQKF